MSVYYIMRSNGKEVFNITGRLEEIFEKKNPHPHKRNGSPHQGLGGPNICGTYVPRHLLDMGYAFHQLPGAPLYGYTEHVWNPPNQSPEFTRVILGEGGEIYLTTDHYYIYYKVFSNEGATYKRYTPYGGSHTIFPV